MYESEDKYALRTYICEWQHRQRGGEFCDTDYENYATPHAIKWRMWLHSYWRKNYQIRTQGIWQLREEIRLLNSELQGVVDNLGTSVVMVAG